jgi:hypothetical protein
MKIENQVCSLEQAKRLKELGVVQKSYFQWNDTKHAEPYINNSVFGESHPPIEFSAFTVAELGVMLYEPEKDWLGLLGNNIIGFHCSYIHEDEMFGEEKSLCSFPNEKDPNFLPTEAQARAEMLIHLLENDIITSEEVNKRLLK